MNTLKHFTIGYFLLVMLSTLSCNRPRRLYLRNKTNKAITLHVDATVALDKGSLQPVFKDSLDGKRIEPGHLIINFGAGKWTGSDEEDLKKILQRTAVLKEGSTEGFRLPQNMPIAHGLLIAELIVTINEP